MYFIIGFYFYKCYAQLHFKYSHSAKFNCPVNFTDLYMFCDYLFLLSLELEAR